MSYINIYNCLLIWNHNMLYYKYNKHTQLLEKRIKWENMKYTTYRKQSDIYLTNNNYNICNICNSYIYPLHIEEWLDIDITNYIDVLKYEKYDLVDGTNYLGIGISKILMSCVCYL